MQLAHANETLLVASIFQTTDQSSDIRVEYLGGAIITLMTILPQKQQI
jgi:hypothetical protein